MAQQAQDRHRNTKNHGSASFSSAATEPVRSRWSPKPEQILILESIFNSGMVNPPKDETVRIRKMLEQFGAVGDANVFYWFQNRRSRSRRRQRQLQAAAAAASPAGGNPPVNLTSQQGGVDSGGAVPHSWGYGGNCSNSDIYFLGTQSQVPSFYHGVSSLASSGSSSLGGIDMENLFTMPSQMGFNEADHHHQYVSNVASNLCPTDQNSNFQFQQGGTITVFINGVPTEVPRGPINTKAMFDEDLVLLHSSGDPLPTDEFGFLMYSLQHGDAYFLVPRQT